MTARATLPLANIRVGKRHRHDMGDIESLAASIEDIGLLHPITVDEDGRLLAGARRLAACKQLDWKEIPVNVVKGRS
jgi:ParB family chromosome partitioning protein